MITNFLILFKKNPLLALLNSKQLEISPKNGWRALAEGEPMTSFPNWRYLLVKIRTFFDENPDCEL
ncbi:MAG: hypothetical protein A3G03_01345 [Candidatus Taylorbacteria bacterium RIFCSPLOWO2_12_FULL_44_15c]|uniref:Uncharacterized protein n=1 Tax=Candidatus Taylorbacteria bacterium RIFCSPLOWO2_12_FULL_44_15c TaxID=1802333 RepID=A0A1G2P589_9BACT|nr:MAG: hypothetical protein A3G03_01345 [Candidatus Taylorbacteria bacterium RIFCSPLOWO2_12_FULL_44_15c]